MKIIYHVSRCLIVLLLALAAVGKLINFGGLEFFLEEAGLTFGAITRVAAIALVLGEILCAVLVAADSENALTANLMLLAIFTAFHAYRILSHIQMPCPCLGALWIVLNWSPVAPYVIYAGLVGTYALARRGVRRAPKGKPLEEAMAA